MNRALGRRTAFETRTDIRVFLALVAHAVREQRVEVHAFSILATHFHLLVRSLDGDLSETLRRIQNVYVRWFNRTRRRDGPLFRGRFRSIPVENSRYVQTLFRYIDQNPVLARLVASAEDYPYGSARLHVSDRRGPRWVCRSLVERFLAPLLAEGVDRAAAYRRAFPVSLSLAQRAFVERRLLHPDRTPDRFDDLVRAATPEVFAWMSRRARLADGTRPGLPLVAPESVEHLVAVHRRRAPDAFVEVGPRRQRSVWDLALVALLRGLAGETFAAIGRRHGATRCEIGRRADEHRHALERDVGYRGIVIGLVRRVLHDERATFPHVETMSLAGDASVSRNRDALS
jgi:hypothetical protein